MLDVFLHGSGQHHHPPLYDLFLGRWMRWIGDSPFLLRLPSVIFFGGAIWIVAATAQLLWGARLLAVVIAVSWPVGFFVGRPTTGRPWPCC